MKKRTLIARELDATRIMILHIIETEYDYLLKWEIDNVGLVVEPIPVCEQKCNTTQEIVRTVKTSAALLADKWDTKKWNEFNM